VAELMQLGAVRLLAACLIALPMYGACVETLAPYKSVELAWTDYPRPQDVSWVDADRVALAVWHGVSVYSLQHGRASELLPADLAENAQRVSSDGRTIVVANIGYSFVAADADSGKVVSETNQLPVLVTDLALHSGRLTILGTPNDGGNLRPALLYDGRVDQPISGFRPVGPLDPQQARTARNNLAMHGGSVVVESGGAVDAIVPWCPGVQRASGAGTVQQTAQSMAELVIPNSADLLLRYAKDFQGRYTQILNKQPIADDLVATSAGVAAVVRKFDGDRVHWSLWFVDAGNVRRTIDLALEQRYPYGGHLRCDARAAKVVCLQRVLEKVGQPPAFNRLHLFDLHDVRRTGKCK
jgi:hypothetical protein